MKEEGYDIITAMQKSWRRNVFRRWWPRQAEVINEQLRALKKELFHTVRGTVLELGPGTGTNFRYFSSDISWLGVEPVEEWHAALRAHPDRPTQMRFSRTLAEVPTASVDTVVSSLVLCSVPDLRETLADIQRVLKPGGQFLCVEHIAAPRGTFRRVLQHLIRPFTKTLGGGCEPDRDIDSAIACAGFSEHTFITYDIPLGSLPFRVPLIACRARV